uniref:Vesicle transport protein n=1 Tax=Acrobeloides nanus TaxID=290746 RepID=A0A914DIU8_9BILA
MSSLADFVNEQRSKKNSFNMANIGNKVSSSFSGFFKVEGADDTETLTDNPAKNGQLPTSRNRKNGANGWFSFASDEGVCGLSRMQRIVLFFMALIAAMFCFGMAAMLIPVLILQTRRFAALNTLGSIFLLVSFGFLWGPVPYVKFLFSPQRRIVTAAYVISVVITLYTSLWLQSSVFTIISAVFEAFALLWFIMSYIPGGDRGMRFMTSVFSGMVCPKKSSLVLPI